MLEEPPLPAHPHQHPHIGAGELGTPPHVAVEGVLDGSQGLGGCSIGSIGDISFLLLIGLQNLFGVSLQARKRIFLYVYFFQKGLVATLLIYGNFQASNLKSITKQRN